MEIKEEVTSPTFNIIKEYLSGDMPLFHMDVYRLDGKVDELGIEEYFTKKGVTIIEWADMIPDYLPEKRLDIKIRNSEDDENKRSCVFPSFNKIACGLSNSIKYPFPSSSRCITEKVA